MKPLTTLTANALMGLALISCGLTAPVFAQNAAPRNVAPQVNPNIPHGTIVQQTYTSPIIGGDEHLHIYTPPGYDSTRAKPYPVVYAFHGLGGQGPEWFSPIGASTLLDNYIAEGKAEPMIFVAPLSNGNVGGNAAQGFPNFIRAMIEEIVPYMEKNYHVSTRAEDRAVIGLSMGAAESMLMLNHVDKFAWIGGFGLGLDMWSPTWGGGRGGLPGATDAQNAAITKLDQSVASLATQATAANTALGAASLASTRTAGDLAAKAEALAAAELALATARADALANLQASVDRLKPDQLEALVQQRRPRAPAAGAARGGAPRGGAPGQVNQRALLADGIIASKFPNLDASINAKLKMLYIGNGTADDHLNLTRQFKSFLESRGVKITQYLEPEGIGHNDEMWTLSTADVLPKLFK